MQKNQSAELVMFTGGRDSRLYASQPDHGRVSPGGWIFREAGAG